jgi:hypothetical protein
LGIGTIIAIKKRKKPELEDTETVIGTPDEIAPPKIDCAVSTSVSEAHASDQTERGPKTYEELYGTGPPAEEVALTKTQLRNYLKEEIRNLEEM